MERTAGEATRWYLRPEKARNWLQWCPVDAAAAGQTPEEQMRDVGVGVFYLPFSTPRLLKMAERYNQITRVGRAKQGRFSSDETMFRAIPCTFAIPCYLTTRASGAAKRTATRSYRRQRCANPDGEPAVVSRERRSPGEESRSGGDQRRVRQRCTKRVLPRAALSCADGPVQP